MLAVCLLVSGVQPMDDPIYGVKLCGREFIRAVIFTCGGSRWKRSVMNAGKLLDACYSVFLNNCPYVYDCVMFCICPYCGKCLHLCALCGTGLKSAYTKKGNRKHVRLYGKLQKGKEQYNLKHLKFHET